MPFKSWLPLVGLTCSTFIFNTSEFIPIGLLTDIAADFSMTEAQAGMLISVYAWVVMLLSLPLMILASKVELRRLMLCLVGFFSAFQVMSFLSVNYWMLMASRIGVACTHSIFWSIVSPVAVKIVSDEHRPLALSMIVTGSSIAMILGMPLGRVIGLHIGWRMTFLSIGVFAFATFLYLLFVLPKVSSDGGFSPRRLPELFRNRALAGLFLFTALYAGSYYTCYSYIEPFMKQVAGMSDELVTAALMIFGGAGLVGSFLFSKYYNRNSHVFTTLVMMSLTTSLLLFYPLSFSSVALIALCVLWGIAGTAYNVSMQDEVISLTASCPESTAVAMSIFSGIFNMGIGCGSFAGGLVCTHLSLRYIGYAGGILAALALLYWLLRLSGLFERAKREV